jgi:hypothetical protein
MPRSAGSGRVTAGPSVTPTASGGGTSTGANGGGPGRAGAGRGRGCGRAVTGGRGGTANPGA